MPSSRCSSVSQILSLQSNPLLTHITASLRLNSVDAKEHAIFTELTRVRQYFEKIQKIENPPQEREQTVNKEAAARFIRSDLVWKFIKDFAVG